MNTQEKVKASHLKRDAYLYVRQSSLQQVFENKESTQRQYALRQRAVALGWPLERVVVIDDDLGQSGASSEEREGFQRLVAEVGMGQALCWGWKCRDWLATRATGTVCWKSAHFPAR